MSSPKTLARRTYFTLRNSWPVWYGILNRRARQHFGDHTPTLSPLQESILSDLQKDGIAFTSLDELFPNTELLNTLQTYANSLSRPTWDKVKKNFLIPYWDRKPEIDFSNPFFSLALSPTILPIVNSYDRMWRRLNYCHLAETIPVGDDAPVQSQRWHRDPEEKRMVKLFIYLSDVDSEAGPFTYVKGSQFQGARYGSLFPQQLPEGVYPPLGAVEQNVEEADIVEATGAAGTVIFCDTAGLHRGGHAKRKHRVMFTAFYPSDLWSEQRLFTVSDATKRQHLSPEARYALFLD